MPSRTAVAVQAEEPKAIIVVRNALEDRAKDLLAVLPPSMDVQRFMRVSLIAISKNPELLECTPVSIVSAIFEAAEIGIEPTGSLNRAWLVGFRPEKGARPEAQLMIGYQGYADLMRDGDSRRRVVAEVVYEGDLFKVIKGTETPRIEHEPAYATEDPTKITYAYAILFYPDGTNQFEVMTKQQVDGIRAKSRQANGRAWRDGYGQMARKSALRRLSNYTPLSVRAIAAIARDDEREFGQAEPGPKVTRNAEMRKLLTDKGVIRESTGTGNAESVVVVPPGQTDKNAPGAKAKPVKNGPGAAETAKTTGKALPDSSASQQAEPAGVVETDGGEPICGATSDPSLGEVETCVLAPGHLEVEGAKRRHQAVTGSVWPA